MYNLSYSSENTHLMWLVVAEIMKQTNFIVAENIIALENGRELKTYNEKKTPMIISLGKYDGIFEYGKFIIAGKIPAFLKWVVERREMMKL